MKKEKISIVPDVSLFAKLGSANYTVSEAISELIDNSIDARERKVNIKINIDKNGVTVEDDGKGMNKETAINSIILGRSSKKTGELGHFGMGLKTSCMSLGKQFSIHTTYIGTNESYGIDFDAEKWEQSKKWDQNIHIHTSSEKNKSGTLIKIKKLKFNIHTNLINSLLEHLSERFGVFINNDEADIVVNGKRVKSQEPTLVKGSKEEFVIKLNNGEIIEGWTGILEKGSQEKSGFNLYRYNRLIRAHEKLGYSYHPSKMWVTGEIHLNPIPITHNKREFIMTNPTFIDFFEKFKEVLKEVINKSQSKNKEEKVKELPKHVTETLKHNLIKALNNFDELKEFAFPGEKQVRKDESGEEQNIEKRDIAGDMLENEHVNKEKTSVKNRTPKKKNRNTAKYITINGNRYKFNFEWANLDDTEKSKEAFLDPANNTIMVLLNTKYKLLDMIQPDILYMIFYISEGIVEVFLKENNQGTEKLVHLRDGIVKRLADVYAEDLEIKIREKSENEIEAYNYVVGSKSSKNTILKREEKKVIELRLEKGMTFKEISLHTDLSEQRTRNIFHNALSKINTKETNKELEENIDIIIKNVLDSYNTSLKDLKSKNRKKDLVMARHIAMYNLRKKLNLSFPDIGKIFERDHTTAIHACERIESLINKEN